MKSTENNDPEVKRKPEEQILRHILRLILAAMGIIFVKLRYHGGVDEDVVSYLRYAVILSGIVGSILTFASLAEKIHKLDEGLILCNGMLFAGIGTLLHKIDNNQPYWWIVCTAIALFGLLVFFKSRMSTYLEATRVRILAKMRRILKSMLTKFTKMFTKKSYSKKFKNQT